MTCPRCGSTLVCGECLTCAFQEKERIDQALAYTQKPDFRWPPHANPTGEHHTRPILNPEELAEEEG